ncbi:MAG: hypothetical protein IH588_13055 [Anaerolineales bacterium]|nr:hypothetical protein [Anaerolineales bacterium]
MNENSRIMIGWPKWLKATFIGFGVLFLSTIVIALVLFVIDNLFTSYALPFWAMGILELITALLFVRLIIFTLRQGINIKSVSISALYGIFGIFLLGFISNQNAELKRLQLDVVRLRDLGSILMELVGKMTTIIEGFDPSLLPDSSPLINITPATPPSSGFDTWSALVLVITAISGLVTAISGLYGQILSARKLKFEFELAKKQSKLNTEQDTKKRSKAPTKKRNTQRKVIRK